MNPEGIKAQIFTLVIDEDRCTVLNAVWASIEQNEDPRSLLDYLERKGLMQSYFDMMSELVDKKHDLGWCKDPTCDYKETK